MNDAALVRKPASDLIAGASLVCSWSGGKDSCLALYQAAGAGGRPVSLLNMLTEDGRRSRSHGLSREVLIEQARAMDLPIRFAAASWAEYENTFLAALRDQRKDGVEWGVFGDIDTDAHRGWVERVCAAAQIQARLPLWKRPRRELLSEFLAAGFVAIIVAVKDRALGRGLLGRRLDPDLIDEIARQGADVCGEFGEYHTCVIDGPLFHRPLQAKPQGQVLRDGYWFLDLAAG